MLKNLRWDEGRQTNSYPYTLGCGTRSDTIGFACLWNFRSCFSIRPASSYNGPTFISTPIIEAITFIADAAASLHIASVLCGERRTQREIGGTAGVTEVTIRNMYKELTKKLGIDIIL